MFNGFIMSAMRLLEMLLSLSFFVCRLHEFSALGPNVPYIYISIRIMFIMQSILLSLTSSRFNYIMGFQQMVNKSYVVATAKTDEKSTRHRKDAHTGCRSQHPDRFSIRESRQYCYSLSLSSAPCFSFVNCMPIEK